MFEFVLVADVTSSESRVLQTPEDLSETVVPRAQKKKKLSTLSQTDDRYMFYELARSFKLYLAFDVLVYWPFEVSFKRNFLLRLWVEIKKLI